MDGFRDELVIFLHDISLLVIDEFIDDAFYLAGVYSSNQFYREIFLVGFVEFSLDFLLEYLDDAHAIMISRSFLNGGQFATFFE
jgi:hypothetical protein